MASFKLQLLHASDLEGGVETLENAPNFSAVVNGLTSEFPENTVILSSGDNYIPGPFFAAAADPSLDEVLGSAGPGRGDIAIMNAIGFDASAFGNHEFDVGTGQVASVIGEDEGYLGTTFPYLSANLDFSTDSNLAGFVVEGGQEASTIPNSIAESAVVTTNGEPIGVVGATTPLLESISSPDDVTVLPADAENLNALAAEIQSAVDALTEQGVDKIILTSHLQQLAVEQQITGLLEDVDIIIAGGSDTLLADETDDLTAGDEAAGSYPILAESKSGEPVAIVSTDGNYTYVGRLVVEFDENGVLIPESINPEVSGAYATDQGNVENLANSLENPEVVAPDPEVVAITDAIGEVIAVKDGNTFGSTEVFLNGERGGVRTQETNLGNLTADANLAIAQEVDPDVVVSIKNGGGIRASIGQIAPETGEQIPPAGNPEAGKEAGEVSQLDIENSLRFNNELTLLTVTAEQLLQVIEHGVAATESGATPGQFPQVSGLAFSFDPDLAAGNRVESLAIKDASGNTIDTIVQNSELVGDANREFRIVTLNFLAEGGDDYPFAEFIAANPEKANRVDLTELELEAGAATFAEEGTEQDALAEYLAANFTEEPFDVEDVGSGQDERIQNLNEKSDSVLSLTSTKFDDVIDGQSGDDTLKGLSGDDILQGGAGNDRLFGGEGNDTLRGGPGSDRLFGGKGNDILRGQEGDDYLVGGRGQDLLYGGSGNNTLTGGNSQDQFWIVTGAIPDAASTVVDFQLGKDAIGIANLSGVTSFDDLTFTNSEAGTLISAIGQELAILKGIQSNSLDSSSFVFT